MAEGVVNVLKPPGMTSSDVVSDIRKLFGIKRVGHTGTLDPGAAGVLPVCLGRATRLFDYLVDKRKRYLAELMVGADTSTQDAYGEVVATGGPLTRQELVRVLPEFTGSQQQRAPLYSAVRLGGKQLYKLARSGCEVDEAQLKIRQIEVYRLELVEQTAENAFLLDIECSKGTYVRTLCQDIAHRAGVCGHMSFLLRTASGEFGLAGAHTLEELGALKAGGMLHTALVPIEEALRRLPEARLSLGERDAIKLQNGAPIKGGWLGGLAAGPLRVYCNGEFLGIGVCGGQGLHISVYLKEEHGC